MFANSRALRATVALALCAMVALASAALPAAAVGIGSSAHTEELTWTELRDRIAAGARTILLPIGGTEQNGPHMVLGKHNVRVRALAGMIAEKLGDTLVAPVISYVPEGSISPPAAHMRYAGTISISEAAFEAMLDGAARSFRQHGFRDVVLLGDHGGYRASLERVASRLNREWARGGAAASTRVHALPQYYLAAQQTHAQVLSARGFSAAEIGSHAGLADTSLALAIDPALVRKDWQARAHSGRDGVVGDPARATAELGQLGVERIVEASVSAIQARLQTPVGKP